MPIYQTTSVINAPVNRVWEVLTDFEHYDDWNPQIPLASGTREEGSKVNRARHDFEWRRVSAMARVSLT